MRRQSAGFLNHSFGSWHSLPDAAPRIEWPLVRSPRGLMDKASDPGSEDCEFDSHRGCLIFALFFTAPVSHHSAECLMTLESVCPCCLSLCVCPSALSIILIGRDPMHASWFRCVLAPKVSSPMRCPRRSRRTR